MSKVRETNAQRRKRRLRFKLKKLNPGKLRLTVFKSNNNIFVQLIDDAQGITLASSSTLALKKDNTKKSFGSNIQASALVGSDIGQKIKKLGNTNIYFDRGSYRYHGRVKELVENVRKHVQF